MRRYRVLAAPALAAAVIGLAAPTAAAWNDPSAISVTPGTIARGGQLTISVRAAECQKYGGTVSSSAFPTTQLQGVPGSSDRSTANVRVNRTASQGSHSVTVRCDGRTLTKSNAFTVIGGVQGGLGGSITGATGTDIAIGGGLVAAAALGGGVALVRRRAERKVA